MVQSLWNDNETAGLDELGLLAYRSNRLGADRSVSNWAGGNTSMKQIERDFRGRPVQTLWVKGSGTDLGTITRNGFAAVRMDDALPLLGSGKTDYVSLKRLAETGATAPLDAIQDTPT